MKVVLDAGPIIALAKVGALRVLPALFDDVLVPSVVMHEVAPRGEKRPGAEIREQPWVRVVRVRLARVASLEHAFDIDPGEAAAIAVAEDDPAASVILMDDRAGLAAARSRGVAVLRTGALLVYASEEKLLSAIEVAAALVKLREERYLSATAEREILRLLASRRR